MSSIQNKESGLSPDSSEDYVWGLPNQFTSRLSWWLRFHFALVSMIATHRVAGLPPFNGPLGGFMIVMMAILYGYLLRGWAIKFYASKGSWFSRGTEALHWATLAASIPLGGMLLVHHWIGNVSITSSTVGAVVACIFAQIGIIGFGIPLVWQSGAWTIGGLKLCTMKTRSIGGWPLPFSILAGIIFLCSLAFLYALVV